MDRLGMLKIFQWGKRDCVAILVTAADLWPAGGPAVLRWAGVATSAPHQSAQSVQSAAANPTSAAAWPHEPALPQHRFFKMMLPKAKMIKRQAHR